MRVALQIAVRNELPDVLNKLARDYERPERYEETRPVDLIRRVEWSAPPAEGQVVWVHPDAAPRTVEDVQWDVDASEVRIVLEALDTDEIGEEGAVIEELLDRGWEIHLESMGWR